MIIQVINFKNGETEMRIAEPEEGDTCICSLSSDGKEFTVKIGKILSFDELRNYGVGAVLGNIVPSP